MKEYLPLISLIIFLMIFYLGLPDLDKVDLKAKAKKYTRADLIVIAVITLFFGIVDFWKLGNTDSPETFVAMGDKTAVITIEDDRQPVSLMFYTGVCTGNYDIEFSEDGINYIKISAYEQTYADVLRWVNISCYSDLNARYIRITGYGSEFLGEVGVLDINDEFIPSPVMYRSFAMSRIR